MALGDATTSPLLPHFDSYSECLNHVRLPHPTALKRWNLEVLKGTLATKPLYLQGHTLEMSFNPGNALQGLSV
jgi:hypothetical protein